MNILHAQTDPSLLARLKEMLGSSDRAEQVQLIFSREYDPAWREDFEV